MANRNRQLVSSLGVASVLCLCASVLAQPATSSKGTSETGAVPSDAVNSSAEQAPANADAAPSASSGGPAPAEATAAASTPSPAQAPPHAAAQQPPPAAATGQPTPVVATPAPAPVPQVRAERMHDGFYLRMAIGTGTGTVVLQDAPNGLSDAMETVGWLDLMAGGTPARGMVVGGGFWAGGFQTEEWRGENKHQGTVTIFGIGPFVDYYPDPQEGFHFGSMVGLGGLAIDARPFSDEQERTATGGAIGAWMGYDFWMAREWSLGLEARYLAVRAKNPDTEWKGSADALGMAITGVYH